MLSRAHAENAAGAVGRWLYSYINMGNIATAISRRHAALSGQHDVLVVGDDAAEVRQLAAQVVAPSQLLLGGRRQVGQHEDALVDEDGDDVFDDADELEDRKSVV